MNSKILVFIPMYNCEKQILRVMEQFRGEICDYVSEMIIVNNCSLDNGEMKVVKKIKEMNYPFKVNVLRNQENYGLGGSHKVAFNYAIEKEFDYVIILHGDDQGSIDDLLPILKKGLYCKYDCCLGARFTYKSKLIGYSKFRILGNYVFNMIFSVAMKRKIYDLGAGLNIYNVNMLRSRYFQTYPDNLTFNVYMLMATKVYGQKYYFFPLSWRETDQVSNAKVMSQAVKTLKMIIGFIKKGKEFLETDSRESKKDKYLYQIVYSNNRGNDICDSQ